MGLRPRNDNIIEFNPLIQQNKWDYFCLDNVLYQNKILTLVWDKYGNKYNRGKGFMLFVDGKLMSHRETIGKIKLSY